MLSRSAASSYRDSIAKRPRPLAQVLAIGAMAPRPQHALLLNEHASREAVQLLRDAVGTGAVRDPAAADIHLAIMRDVRSSEQGIAVG